MKEAGNNLETVNEQEKAHLKTLIRDAQRGDPYSMRMLGDYYLGISNSEKKAEAYRTGIEWYERAAWCSDIDAAKRVIELTGAKTSPPNFLKQLLLTTMLMLVLWFIMAVKLLFSNETNAFGMFLLAIGIYEMITVMNSTFQINETINSKHYKHWNEFMRNKELQVLSWSFMLVSTYSLLISGFVLTIWNSDHERVLVLIAKTIVFIAALTFVSLDFLRLVRVKWKYAEHNDNITRTADEFETTRLKVEVTFFLLKATACFSAVILVACKI